MPPSPRKTALFIEAEKLRLAEKFDKAVPIYKAILAEDPGDQEVRRTLAGLYLVTGNKPQGLQEYLTLVSAAIDGGEIDKAEQLLARVRNLDREKRFGSRVDILNRSIAEARAKAAPAPQPPIQTAPSRPVQAAPLKPSPVAPVARPAVLKPATAQPPAAASPAALRTPAPSRPATATRPAARPPAILMPAADVTEDDVKEAEQLAVHEARDPMRSSANLSNVLFKALPPDVLNRVIRACEKVSFARGSVVFEEGSTARALYIVGHGIVEVQARHEPEGREANPQDSPKGGTVVRVAKLGPGELFGEMAFLTGSRREATVVADSDCLCYRLSQTDAEKIMAEHPNFRQVAIDLYKERVVGLFMSTSKMLSGLPLPAREALLAAFVREVAKEGATIVEEGSTGDDLYFIKRGEVKVVTTTPKGPVELARMGKQELFGEISLLTGAPRTASVIAVRPTELLRVGGPRLRAIVEQYPALRNALKDVHLRHAAEAAEKLLGKR